MAGLGSRRKMDALIAEGAVTINGKPVTSLGVRVDPVRDRVMVEGRMVGLAEKPVYILLNKPKDAITTVSDERDRRTVMDYVRVRQRVFPVGRLDRNTTGVLLLTNDGVLAHALLHPKFEIERVYRVTTARPVQDDEVAKLRRGVRLEDGLAKAQEVEIVEGSKRKKVLLSIGEGRNREVRRMFEVLGHDVRQLDRVSYAGLTPLGVPRGNWRFLTKDEVQWLRRQTGQETRTGDRRRQRQG
ncbi:MAG: rRNA pseudouridine synthase [Bacteroidetes bacterium]|jgi:pseudouridine synthase|nr:rRNA pseudouridine synthase [Bacteroidota bacterium]